MTGSTTQNQLLHVRCNYINDLSPRDYSLRSIVISSFVFWTLLFSFLLSFLLYVAPFPFLLPFFFHSLLLFFCFRCFFFYFLPTLPPSFSSVWVTLAPSFFHFSYSSSFLSHSFLRSSPSTFLLLPLPCFSPLFFFSFSSIFFFFFFLPLLLRFSSLSSFSFPFSSFSFLCPSMTPNSMLYQFFFSFPLPSLLLLSSVSFEAKVHFAG